MYSYQMIRKESVVDDAFEEMVPDYRLFKQAEIAKFTTSIDNQGHICTQTDHVEHYRCAAVIPTQNDLEEGV